MKENESYIISSEAKALLEEKNNPSTSRSTSSLKFSESLKAIAFALIIGLIIIVITSLVTSGDRGDYGPISFIEETWTRNFGNKMYFTALLSRLSYLIPLGLALVVSFRMGIFNIGASGQSFLGGFMAFWVASVLDIGAFGFIITLSIGILVGMSMALIVAFLKVKFRINEVITSIMFNWIALYLIVQFTSNIDASSATIDNNDLRFEWVNSIMFGSSNVSSHFNLGVLIMFPLAIVIWFLYSKTKWGYKQDLIGNNTNVGKYLGIKSDNEIYKTMALSGGLAGLAGVIYLLGYDNGLTGFGSEFTDIPAATFDGITISLIGYNSPIGVIFSSILIGVLKADGLDQQIGSYHITDIMMALMIVFIAISTFRIKYGKRGGK